MQVFTHWEVVVEWIKGIDWVMTAFVFLFLIGTLVVSFPVYRFIWFNWNVSPLPWTGLVVTLWANLWSWLAVWYNESQGYIWIVREEQNYVLWVPRIFLAMAAMAVLVLLLNELGDNWSSSIVRQMKQWWQRLPGIVRTCVIIAFIICVLIFALWLLPSGWATTVLRSS